MWDRLLGCFGDALLRKFGAEPPPEWVAGLSMLSAAQHERGLRRVVFGWKGGPPSLPDFVRLCRSIGDDIDEGPKPVALPAPDTFSGDEWDVAANRYLRGHLTLRLYADPHRYGRRASSRTMQDASPEFVANVALLVEAKRCWAVDMRAIGREVDPEVQKAHWHLHIDAAEREIDVRMGSKVA